LVKEAIKETKSSDKRNVYESLSETILTKRNEAIEGRISSGIERRWLEDENAFNGADPESVGTSMIDYAMGVTPPPRSSQDPNRSQVVINIVRSKSELAKGRFSDILLPVDDRNWGLKVTPNPELSQQLKDKTPALHQNGGPLMMPPTDNEPSRQASNADVAKARMDDAKEKMKLMETEIDDQLCECNFNSECRKAVDDSVRLGTGVLKGPNIVRQLKKVWLPHSDGERTVHVLKIEEDFQPASKRIDPWNVYPDPNCGEDIKRAAYIWERDFILPREVRALVGVEGYDRDQILAVLEERPKRLQVSVKNRNYLEIKFDAVAKGKAYEIWEYHGDIDREDLEAIGVDCSSDPIGAESLSGCIVFINDKPVKVILNPLDTGDLPYDFFQWTVINGSPWGCGIPRILIWLNRVIIAAWRAMMDNTGDSSGANIVIGNDIQPDDGRWEITAKKIWRALGEVEDVSKAFAQFQIQNNQKEIQAVIELALKFVDMETSLPMLFQGEKGETPETLGATNIMVDANNVALRPRVKLWDDKITIPHLTRYYDWNMQYSNNIEMKGDYQVDARGTSELLAKDQMVKGLIPVMQLRADPYFQDRIDWDKASKKFFSAQNLDILKSDTDFKDAQKKRSEAKPPQDPRIQGDIDIATIRAEAELQKIEKMNKFEADVLNYKEMISQKDRQHEVNMKEMDYQIKMMEYAEKRNISLDKVKADLAAVAGKLNLQRELAHSKMTGPQVTTPYVEPEGRAKEGRAFPE
jgi:hypothetical protein